MARIWNEAALEAIRLDTPRPTVHARNLFHLSAVVWDAWTAYDDAGTGYFVDLDAVAPDGDVDAARTEAISYAAHRLLTERYSRSVGGAAVVADLALILDRLCYPLDPGGDGDDPAFVGVRIADAAIQHGLADGSLEADAYADRSYGPPNPPLVVADSGANPSDPNLWQPLQIADAVTQNGLVTSTLQSYIGSHWGTVTPFSPGTTDLTVADPPVLGTAELRDAVIEVIERSAALALDTTIPIDVSPGSVGDNPLGTDRGNGHPVNPVTGEPYEPNLVVPGDFGRALAEFWADGPRSETPPGHWNVIANEVGDDELLVRRIGGTGPVVDRLEWDVRLYFALNAATHDAAIAAWRVKRNYQSARPISLIRYLGGLGQSSDPGQPAYHPDGLPLVPGLVELVTRASSAPGQRHGHLSESVGRMAVRSFDPFRRDPANSAGVGWVPAVDWWPFQRTTFVTPAFPGYVSGHSTFSRAAAEVLSAFTGSPYFPGGMGSRTIPARALTVGEGPTRDLTLQWATYFDAADQAGQSRIYGGIHVSFDDFAGRRLGAEVGQAAWALVQDHFAGTIPEVPSP